MQKDLYKLVQSINNKMDFDTFIQRLAHIGGLEPSNISQFDETLDGTDSVISEIDWIFRYMKGEVEAKVFTTLSIDEASLILQDILEEISDSQSLTQ